jgi:hypothetical protein
MATANIFGNPDLTSVREGDVLASTRRHRRLRCSGNGSLLPTEQMIADILTKGPGWGPVRRVRAELINSVMEYL